MAVFTNSSINSDYYLWQIYRYGPATLYYRKFLFEAAIQQLHQRNYLVFEFDCQKYDTGRAILTDIASALGVIQDYDRQPNLSGFDDYLYDLVLPDETGIVLALKSFELFQSKFPDYAHHLLDIVARHYHRNLLFGLRFIALVQSNDPNLKIEPICAFNVHWNDAEWMKKHRIAEE